MEAILEKIEMESNKIEELRGKLIQPKKIQLHSGIEGWNSPKAYGIYRHTGGDALGVVGESFKPMDLSMFLDSIVNSITQSNLDLDINKLNYTEYRGGKKIAFSIPLKDFEIKESRMVGDIVATKLLIKTGFDGNTKCSISYSCFRLWCKNGSGAWHDEEGISFKNTKNNMDKLLVFSENLIKVANDVEDYIKRLGKLALKSITQSEMDEYYLRVFGINRYNYQESHKRTQNIFDAINQATAIELQNTGDNLYSLLNGTTRFLTHNVAEGSEEEILFSNVANTNQIAHSVVFSMN